MVNAIRRFARQNSGTAAIEYGLLAGLVALSVVGACYAMSDSLIELFNMITAELKAVIAGA